MSLSRFFSVSLMIRLMLLIGVVAVFMVIVQSCSRPETGLAQYSKGSLKRLVVLETPPSQPQLSFTGPDGAQMRLQDYKGKVILLNVWATWCAPCIIEMPMLNDLQSLRGGDDFEVVTVSLDRQAEEAEAFFKDNKLTALTPWHDSSYALSARVNAPGLPVSIFYSKTGRELARITGEVDWTSEEALALIDKILEH